NQGQTTFSYAEKRGLSLFLWFLWLRSFERDLEIPQHIYCEGAARVDHDRGVRGLDDRRSLDPVADGELLAVVDARFPQLVPLNRARLANGVARDGLRAALGLDELRPGRQRTRAQAAYHDLELRAGERRAAAVEFFVTLDKDTSQGRLVVALQAFPGQEHLHFVDLPPVPHVERKLEALARRGDALARHERLRLFL